MMKIDSHQHFWKYNPAEYGWMNDEMNVLRRDFLPQELEQELSSAGFDGSIAVQARQSLQETEWLLDLAGDYNFIRGVVGWIDLRSTECERQILHFMKNERFVGVRHIVQDEPDDRFLLQPDFINGLHYLQKYNLTYDLLIFPRHLQAAVQLVSQFPDLRFVLDHLAKPPIKSKNMSPWQDKISELAGFPNVWCKVSGMVTEADWHGWTYKDFVPYLDTVFTSFGVERLLIGSDWPVCTLAGNYRQVISIIFQYIEQFSSEQQAAILGQNAIRAYKLITADN